MAPPSNKLVAEQLTAVMNQSSSEEGESPSRINYRPPQPAFVKFLDSGKIRHVRDVNLHIPKEDQGAFKISTGNFLGGKRPSQMLTAPTGEGRFDEVLLEHSVPNEFDSNESDINKKKKRKPAPPHVDANGVGSLPLPSGLGKAFFDSIPSPSHENHEMSPEHWDRPLLENFEQNEDAHAGPSAEPPAELTVNILCCMCHNEMEIFKAPNSPDLALVSEISDRILCNTCLVKMHENTPKPTSSVEAEEKNQRSHLHQPRKLKLDFTTRNIPTWAEHYDEADKKVMAHLRGKAGFDHKNAAHELSNMKHAIGNAHMKNEKRKKAYLEKKAQSGVRESGEAPFDYWDGVIISHPLKKGFKHAIGLLYTQENLKRLRYGTARGFGERSSKTPLSSDERVVLADISTVCRLFMQRTSILKMYDALKDADMFNTLANSRLKAATRKAAANKENTSAQGQENDYASNRALTSREVLATPLQNSSMNSPHD